MPEQNIEPEPALPDKCESEDLSTLTDIEIVEEARRLRDIVA